MAATSTVKWFFAHCPGILGAGYRRLGEGQKVESGPKGARAWTSAYCPEAGEVI